MANSGVSPQVPTPFQDDPVWGCGLLGKIPGISESGEAAPETQRFIDALKLSSSFNKAGQDQSSHSCQTFFEMRACGMLLPCSYYTHDNNHENPEAFLLKPVPGDVLELEPGS